MMTDPIWKNEVRSGDALQKLYRGYGYIPYKMSRFEEYDLYVRNKDFLVSDQIITFSDRSGRLLALKPDVTLSIVKNAPEQPGVVQKVYYQENVYRDYREILQAGLECVGDLGDYEIAAGTYHFTLLAGYDTAYGGGKSYQFTLTKAVPAGGVIMFPWSYQKQASTVLVSTYESRTATTAIESVAVTEGTGGTALDTLG